MDSEFFKDRAREIHSGQRNASAGFIDEDLLKEFFDNNKVIFQDSLSHISDKTCLDIGPCVATPMKSWDVTDKRMVLGRFLCLQNTK